MAKLFKYSYLLTLILFGLGQIGRIYIPDHPIYFYSYEIPLFVSLMILFFHYRLKIFRNAGNLEKVTAVFLGWLLLSYLFLIYKYNILDNFIAFLYLVRLTIHLLFFMYFLHFYKERQAEKYLDLSVRWFSGWVIFTSAVQYFLYPNIGNIAYLGWDPHIMRSVGIFLEPPLAVSAYFFIFSYFVNSYFLHRKIGDILFSISSLLLLGLTYSRAGYLGFGLVLALFIIRHKKLKLGIILVIFSLMGLFFISNSHVESLNLARTTTIVSRIEDYKEGISIWGKNRFFGIGYNRIRFEKSKFVDEVFVEDYNPSHGITSFHSSFLTILVTSGVVGLSIYILYLWEIGKMSEYAFSTILFLVAISFFDNMILHPFVLFLLPVFIASCPARKST